MHESARSPPRRSGFNRLRLDTMRSHRTSVVVAIVALALTGTRDLAAAASLVPILAPVSTIARGALQPVLQFDSKSADPYAAVSATGLDQQALARFKQTKHGF